MAAPPLLAEWVTSQAGLDALAGPWRRLWERDADSDVFGGYDWFHNWWAHFGGADPGLVTHDGAETMAIAATPGAGARLCVCVLRQPDGEAAAILPLVGLDGRFKGLRCRILASPLNDHSPRSAILAAHFGDATAAALGNALLALPGWDILLLDGLPAEQGRPEKLAAALSRSGAVRGAASEWAHSCLALRGSYDQFLEAKERNFRKHVFQNRRALEKLGPLGARCYADEAAGGEGMDIFFAIDSQSWKARDGEAVGLNAGLKQFYGGLCRRLAADGHAEVWVLSIGADPVAAYLCLADRGRRYTLKTSFHGAYGGSTRISPSNVLLDELIRQSWAQRGTRVDFVGKRAFVERWANEERRFAQLLVYRSARQAWRWRARDWLARPVRKARGLVAGLRA
jgi:hypothetical protein